MAKNETAGHTGSRSPSIKQSETQNTQTLNDLLVVFDRLEVGPVRLEKNRLVAPYRLTINDETLHTELIYRYEEPVFEPEEPESQNLAAMIAAQVALNYGLFCHQLVFHGRYDATDRRFIRDMAENTAREIYVKKFLEPNPFLVGEAARLAPKKLSRYLQAAIRFSDKPTAGGDAKWQLWPTDRNRHCVLSSGGKDSLLSYGLLNEIGREVHPIFVNESGRHWFTALNAYRHFRDQVANTARVWVNSDRVFAWMLSHMPFIRKNFADIRSDEYPIRLWTVAVFLFGVLPLIRKRGIGRILIGDEFDTTVRVQTHGITHYDGLFDQSRYFDDTMSRYFMRKGWAVSQFSILRPLSELLIEKILAERYPHLLVHQTSCHATHKTDERVSPCGKCEKCRRIVSMLKAIDVDPQQCGYTESQIEYCLQSFIDKGVSQEAAGKMQLVQMLTQKGLIDIPPNKQSHGRSHPEILQLRFDSNRSSLDAIPVDLRKPLWTIYCEHAQGAVKRRGHRWESYDLYSDRDSNIPFAFEPPLAGPNGQSLTNRQTFLWGEMSWPEAEKRLKQIDIALLPVGAIEQHGPHLPLDTDAFDAEYLAHRVATACSPPRPLILPTISFGVSYHHDQFTGTLSISNDTLSRLVHEVGVSAARNGIKKLVIINGHGGNSPALNYAAQLINRDTGIFVCVDTGETSDVDINRIVETPNDVHAGEIETSTALTTRPHLVNMDQAATWIPEFSSQYLEFSGKRSISWYTHTREISDSGVLGDPTKASIEKGDKIWETMVAHLVALVEDIKHMPMEEIYHRRR